MKKDLLAPNGKPSNLTAEQYKLVRTPAFKKWFGDWENDPTNASKVIDKNGEPLIVYHGSEKKFNVFDVNKISSSNSTDVAKLGFWFTSDLWEAEGFAYGFDESERVEGVGKVYQCFLSIKNPLKINLIQKELKKTYNSNDDIAGMYIEENQNEIKKIFIKSNKFDGYNLDNIWLSIKPSQIKLADGTNTAFDKDNNDIRFDGGGNVGKNEPNYGRPSIPYSDIPLIHETSNENAKIILEKGFDLSKNKFITSGVYTVPKSWKRGKFEENDSTKELVIRLKEGVKIFWTNSERPTDYYLGYGNDYYEKLYDKINLGYKSPKDDNINRLENQKDFCRRMEKWLKKNGYAGVQQGGEIVITDLSAIDYVYYFERENNTKYITGGNIADSGTPNYLKFLIG